MKHSELFVEQVRSALLSFVLVQVRLWDGKNNISLVRVRAKTTIQSQFGSEVRIMLYQNRQDAMKID